MSSGIFTKKSTALTYCSKHLRTDLCKKGLVTFDLIPTAFCQHVISPLVILACHVLSFWAVFEQTFIQRISLDVFKMHVYFH